MTCADRALFWLCYIHLTEFDRLPSSLFDPAESGPSRLVCRESFLLPWRTAQDISTQPDILSALFKGTEPPGFSAHLSTVSRGFNLMSCVSSPCRCHQSVL